jgi:glycosyltransferase involved in cell wall biosynthesis
MRVAHLIYAFPTGGKETMLVDIINEQVKYADISLIIINDIYDKALIKNISNKVSVHLIERGVGSLNPFSILNLNYILINKKFDMIHCHDYTLVRLILPFIKCKKILTLHAMDMGTKYHYRYDKLFAISEAVQQHFKKFSFDSKVLYNGIKVDDILFKSNNKSTIFSIVQVGRLDHESKGQHILLYALSVLINKYSIRNIHLDFIGEGLSLHYLMNIVEELNLNDYVSFLGLCSRKYIYTHLSDYNLLVQPSLFEGFGLTIIEALAAGIEVLVSDIAGPLEIIEKIGYGYIFNSGNAEDCALKIFEIYSNANAPVSQPRHKLQRLACKYYFDVEITAKNYLDEYRNTLTS